MSHKTGYGTGISNVGSYQVSGKPWLSGGIATNTTEKIVFPSVTQWIYISSSAAVKVGMSDNGAAGTNYITVNTAGGQNLPILTVKCTELYFNGTATVDVMAGLTGIAVSRLDSLSDDGPNWSGSSGIG